MKRFKETEEIRGLSVTYVINRKNFRGKRRSDIEGAIDYAESQYQLIRQYSRDIAAVRNDMHNENYARKQGAAPRYDLDAMANYLDEQDALRRIVYLKLSECHKFLMKLGVVAYTH